MATAEIYVDAAAGRPANVKALGATVNLTNLNDVGVVSWTWTVVDAPPGTTAALSDPAVPAPTYGPLDIAGTYWLRLAVNGAAGDWQTDAEVDEIVIRVRTVGAAIVIPAPGETVQGGADGWSDWTSGMNDALNRLMAGRTLQATYDASAPTPRILIDPAAGGVISLQADAAVTGVLFQIADNGAVARAQFYDDGRIALTPVLGAGEYGINLDSAGVGPHLRLQDSIAGTSLIANKDSSLTATAIFAAGSPVRAFDLDAQGYTTALLRLQDSLGSGGDPIDLVMGATGAITSRSKSAVAGFVVDAKNAIGSVADFRDSAIGGRVYISPGGRLFVAAVADTDAIIGNVASGVGELLTLLNVTTGAFLRSRFDGAIGVLGISAAGSPVTGFDADLRGYATNVFRLQDSTARTGTGVWAVMDAGGKLVLRSHITTGEYALDVNALAFGALPAHFLRLWDGANTALTIGQDGRIVDNLGLLQGIGAIADAAGFDQVVAAGTTIVAPNVFSGYRADGTALTVNNGAVARSFVSDLTGATLGATATVAGFHARATSQDTPAYSVGLGAGDAAFAGYVLFGYADVATASGAGGWNQTILLITGPSCCWTAPAGSLYVAIPLHIPPGATLDAVSVHVFDASVGVPALNMYVFKHDAVSGAASGDTQTLLAGPTKLAAIGEGDISVSGLAIVVPKATAAVTAQPVYWILLESRNNNDAFYSGYAKFTYTELQLGD